MPIRGSSGSSASCPTEPTGNCRVSEQGVNDVADGGGEGAVLHVPELQAGVDAEGGVDGGGEVRR